MAVLVASGLALAACGGTASTAKSDNGDVPGLAAMLGATEQANTARFDLRMHMESVRRGGQQLSELRKFFGG